MSISTFSRERSNVSHVILKYILKVKIISNITTEIKRITGQNNTMMFSFESFLLCDYKHGRILCHICYIWWGYINISHGRLTNKIKINNSEHIMPK